MPIGEFKVVFLSSLINIIAPTIKNTKNNNIEFLMLPVIWSIAVSYTHLRAHET